MRSTDSIGRATRGLRNIALGAVLAAAIASASPARAGAQALGPQRQFLSLEPYYARMMFDAGSGSSRVGANGYGGRLWINMAPFSGPDPNLLGHMGLALFATYVPDQASRGASFVHYGLEDDIFFVNRPLGGVIDPFISVAGGAFRTKVFATGDATTKFALTPGAGIRIPLANRLQLRVDAHDVLLFGVPDGSGGNRTTSNYEFTAAAGITF